MGLVEKFEEFESHGKRDFKSVLFSNCLVLHLVALIRLEKRTGFFFHNLIGRDSPIFFMRSDSTKNLVFSKNAYNSTNFLIEKVYSPFEELLNRMFVISQAMRLSYVTRCDYPR